MKKTSEEWSKSGILKGSTILDPDGWDRRNFEYSWYQELITEKEFQHRASYSTGVWTRSYIGFDKIKNKEE